MAPMMTGHHFTQNRSPNTDAPQKTHKTSTFIHLTISSRVLEGTRTLRSRKIVRIWDGNDAMKLAAKLVPYMCEIPIEETSKEQYGT